MRYLPVKRGKRIAKPLPLRIESIAAICMGLSVTSAPKISRTMRVQTTRRLQDGFDAAVFAGNHMFLQHLVQCSEVFIGEACATFRYGFKRVCFLVVSCEQQCAVCCRPVCLCREKRPRQPSRQCQSFRFCSPVCILSKANHGCLLDKRNLC